MNQETITLSSAGLKNIVKTSQEGNLDFSFIFGEKEIKIPTIFAEFISPIVSHLHQSDPTIDTLNFNDIVNNIRTLKKKTNNNKFITEATLSNLAKISQGYPIPISTNKEEENIERRNLLYLSIFIGNDELYQKLKHITIMNNESTEIETSLEELDIFYTVSRIFPGIEYFGLINDIAKKLRSKDKEKMKSISKPVLYLLITSPHFNFDDEDCLVDIINDVFTKSSNDKNEYEEEELYINIFYEAVDFSQISIEKIEEMLNEIDYTKMTKNLWNKICEVIKNNIKSTKRKGKEEQTFEFDGNSNHRFEGIIFNLSKKSGGNVSDKGIVDVASSNFQPEMPPKNAVDFDSSNYFKSYSSDGQAWLKYDFKDRKIRPTHYSIRTRNNSDNHNPRTWVIEVSNTGQENDWRTIDTKSNVSSVSKRNQSDTFEISTKLASSEFYRYIRFRHTDFTSGNCSDLAISSLEYFGDLI